jgi:hypothetical protein
LSDFIFRDAAIWGLAEVVGEPAGTLAKVAGGNDIITVEDTAGLVAGDGHGDSLRYAASYEVAHNSTPEVVEELARHTGRPTG